MDITNLLLGILFLVVLIYFVKSLFGSSEGISTPPLPKPRTLSLGHRLYNLKNYPMPESVMDKFKAQFPTLSDTQVQFVVTAFKDFIALSIENSHRSIAMPSRIVDELWHLFLEEKEEYEKFCSSVLGRYLIHNETPGSSKGSDRNHPLRVFSREVRETYILLLTQLTYSRDYQYSTLNGRPLLFTIDTFMPIPTGYFYDETSWNLIYPTNNRPHTPSSRAKSASRVNDSSPSTPASNSSDSDALLLYALMSSNTHSDSGNSDSSSSPAADYSGDGGSSGGGGASDSFSCSSSSSSDSSSSCSSSSDSSSSCSSSSCSSSSCGGGGD